MRERGEELVLHAACILRLCAGRVQGEEHVSHLGMPTPGSERRAHNAQDGSDPDGTLDQRDVAQLVEQRERAQRRSALFSAREEKHGDVGPRRLAIERVDEHGEPGIVERFLGENDSISLSRQRHA